MPFFPAVKSCSLNLVGGISTENSKFALSRSDRTDGAITAVDDTANGTVQSPLYLNSRVGIRDVNWSPKILDLRKGAIRTSVGQPIFSWRIFGRSLVIAVFKVFFFFYIYRAQLSEIYCNTLSFSLFTSVTVREHLECVN